ncbi:hypothetical protein JT27_18080 [Alcaligenes faecalis]|uniref:hypothetical protein n=1 Tax=Alcaligenes faecalis TaxID=511 RepID=UPI00052C00CE|nr:hypothetical protein [Alcaligenes faecalis]KGP00242.1 hypothetical protein JT27_18080 [Alcaligenes faecalis]
MITVFDKPLFKLKPDVAIRSYVNIRNSLELTRAGRQVGKVQVQVPAVIFPIIRSLGVQRGETAYLYMDEVEPGRVVFGLATDASGENESRLWDFWVIRVKDLPPFIGRYFT